jgi:hypothetical protein
MCRWLERALLEDITCSLFDPFNKEKFVMYLSDFDDFLTRSLSCNTTLET